jgi:hypothetical protein
VKHAKRWYGWIVIGFLSLPVLGDPIIFTSLVERTANWGDRVVINVSASSELPMRYAWRLEDRVLVGATNASLILPAVTHADSGNYSVQVSDADGTVLKRVVVLSVPAPARLDARLDANVRLGEDPELLPSNRRAQVEPHVIRDPTRPNVLLATFQEGRLEDGGAVAGGYSISRDGGATWSRDLIPGLTRLAGGEFSRASDSVAAIDRVGNLYLSHVGMEPGPPPTVAVINKSTDGGLTFGPATVALEFKPELDKTWLVIDTFPASPTANRLLLMANFFGGKADQLWTTFSDDGATSWSPPVTIGTTNGVFGQPFFLPGGQLGAVYFHYLDRPFESTANAQLEFVLSKDGGRTFEKPVVIPGMPGRVYDAPIARDAWDLPSVCTDQRAGVMYVTLQAMGGSPTNQRPVVLFTRSIDRGQTWSTPVAVNDTPGKASVFNPCIAASPDGQHVTIAFYDKRHNTSASAGNLVDYYLAESFDGGETWEPNLRLSDVTSDLRKAPLASYGRMLADYQGIVPALSSGVPGVAVWIDTRNGNPDPYSIRIHRTRGSTFETWRKLRFGPAELAAGDSLAAGDPDGDGIPNVMEYAMGLEPGQRDAWPPSTVARVEDRTALSMHLHWSVAADDVEWTALLSRDLVNWAEAATELSPEPIRPSGLPEDMTPIRVSVSLKSFAPGFVRLGARLKTN